MSLTYRAISGFTTLLVLTVPVICHGQGGVITTVAGTGSGDFSGDGGQAASAGVPSPVGVTVDSAGNYYILESGNPRVRKVSASGVINTIAGNGGFGYSGDGGPATAAQFSPTHGIAIDRNGNLYIADLYNNRIRKVDTTTGIVTTVAGNGTEGYSGDGGPATAAMLDLPIAVAVDSPGNLYIADSSNYRIRKVDKNTGLIGTVAGNGNALPHGGTVTEGIPATSVAIQQPKAVAVDAAGNIYFADYGRVRKVDTSGNMRTVAGDGTIGSGGDGGPGPSAQVFGDVGLAIDNGGNVYIAENANKCIRMVNPAGIISTIAGNRTLGVSGDGGPAIAAQFDFLQDVALDSAGNLYIADSSSNRIRKVTALTPSTAPAISLAANAFGEVQVIAPNTWVEIKGVNLAPAGDSRIWAGSDFPNGQMPTQLDGVSVMVNGKNAFVYYISPTQVNILTPPDAMSGTVQVQLTRGGVKSNAMPVQAQPYSPSFFVLDGSHVTGTHANGSLLGPAALYPGLTTPAQPGETVILYANGFGPTSSPVVSGAPTQSGTLPALPIVAIGGYVAIVQFAGLVSPGLFQFNVVIPASAPDGDNAISAVYNGVTTQVRVILAVQR